MNEIKDAVKIAQKLQKAGKIQGELTWTKYTTGYDFGLDKAYNDYVKILKSKKNYEVINELLQKSLNPDDKRRIELLKKEFEPYHLSEELNELDNEIQQLTMKLSGVINQHRNRIDSKEVSLVEIFRILGEEKNQVKRKKAYLALSQVNKPLVDAGFIDLINLRNEYARLSGANDFVEYQLKRLELDLNTFDGWKDEAKIMSKKLNGIRNEYAEKYLKTSEIENWDTLYLSSIIAPIVNTNVDMTNYYEPIKNLYLKFGFDISKNNVTYDIFPRKNKSEWGHFFNIDSKVDSRILANVQNRYNEYGVLLHETGHALHYFSLDNKDDILNYGISDIIFEGFANFFGSYLYEDVFYEDIFDKKLLNRANDEFSYLKEWKHINKVREMSHILFDQELYRTDIQRLDDINQLKWNLEKDLFDKDPYDTEPLWGQTIHHTMAPITLHSYLMGDATFDMMKNVFYKKEKLTSVNENPNKFGEFILKELIRPSGKYTFNDLFKRISGDEFTLRYMVE